MHSLIVRLIDEEEMTVFLITHDLAEAEKLCRRVALVHRGKLRTIGRPEVLCRHLKPQRTYTINSDPLSNVELSELQDLNPAFTYTSSNQETTGVLQFKASGQEDDLSAIVDHLGRFGIIIHTIEGAPPTREEVFAHYTADTAEV
jgi:ABC-2 type transport system ATP-binding protein